MKGLIYGAATQASILASDASYSAAFAAECGLIGSEDDYKWGTIHPAQDRFNFAPGDAVAAFAKTNGQALRGHTLVWHMSLPDWLPSTLTPQNGAQLLSSHIGTVVGHYAGMMHSWDVVNEAINLADGRPDGLRKTLWLDALGPDYLDIAFRSAAAADPGALLVYNDYGIEYNGVGEQRKRSAVLKLLQGLLDRGAPVQALGIQGHLDGARTDFSDTAFVDFLSSVAAMGLGILITELDGRDENLPADIVQRDTIVAGAYAAFLAAALSVPAVHLVMTWGLSDRRTWLTTAAPRPDGLPVRPLPLDADLKRKPAWLEIARAFDNLNSS